MKVLQLSTVHPRGDTRILLKETLTLWRTHGNSVALAVADGLGDTAQTDSSPAIHDLGKPGGGRVGRFIVGSYRAFQLARKLRPQVVHFHDPELIPVGFALKLTGVKVVYDVHEDVPRQIQAKHWIPRPLRSGVALAMTGIEGLAAIFFDALVAATPKIAERFPEHKTVTIQNFPLPSEFVVPVDRAYRERPQSFGYIGGVSRMRGAQETVAALGLLAQRCSGVTLELAGNFTPAAFGNELKQQPGWDHVNYHGYVDRQTVAALLGRLRAGLVVLQPTKSYIDAYPVKLFEYMAAGLPVIASDFPLWRSIVDGAQCGLLVDPMKPGEIANAMQWILENPDASDEMGLRGQRAVITHYNWGSESIKLLKLYDRLLS
jgi:glycosyltransferase involved in cell wall biosynthesis